MTKFVWFLTGGATNPGDTYEDQRYAMIEILGDDDDSIYFTKSNIETYCTRYIETPDDSFEKSSWHKNKLNEELNTGTKILIKGKNDTFGCLCRSGARWYPDEMKSLIQMGIKELLYNRCLYNQDRCED